MSWDQKGKANPWVDADWKEEKVTVNSVSFLWRFRLLFLPCKIFLSCLKYTQFTNTLPNLFPHLLFLRPPWGRQESDIIWILGKLRTMIGEVSCPRSALCWNQGRTWPRVKLRMLVSVCHFWWSLCLLVPGESCHTDGTYAYDADFSCCSSLWVSLLSRTPLCSLTPAHRGHSSRG